jgi:hypothetical protein
MEVPQLDAEALEKQREALDSMLARMSMGASQHDEYDHGDAVTAVQASETQIQALDAAVQNYQERVRKAKENWSAGVGVGVGVGVGSMGIGCVFEGGEHGAEGEISGRSLSMYGERAGDVATSGSGGDVAGSGQGGRFGSGYGGGDDDVPGQQEGVEPATPPGAFLWNMYMCDVYMRGCACCLWLMLCVMFVCVCVCICIHTYVRTYVRIYVIHICIYVYIYIYIYICIWKHYTCT